MIVTAALCWWKERPEDLTACVRGVAQVADRVIALDGAYRRYPGATVRSDPSQARTIRDAATEAGIDCLVLRPDRLWAGQVEKRSYLLNLAAVGSDWIMVVDTDHIVSTVRIPARSALTDIAAAGDYDVIEVPFRTPIDPSRPIEATAPHQWHIEQTKMVRWIPQFYRALPGLRVERFHWWYSALRKGQRVWLWNEEPNPEYPVAQRTRLEVPYEVEHRCLFRTPAQVRASRAFIADREMVVSRTGQEDDAPGLPSPTWLR